MMFAPWFLYGIQLTTSGTWKKKTEEQMNRKTDEPRK